MNINNIKNESDLNNISIKTLLIEIIGEQKKMKKELQEIKKWVNIKKKKINILNWLNKNYKLNTDYKEFIEKINIEIDDILYIFKTDLIEGIINIFKKYESDIPLKSYDQKENILYVFKNNKWEILNDIDFNNLISKIYQDILNKYKIWENTNETKIKQEQEYSEEYLKNLKKIIGGNNSFQNQKNKIHKILYKNLKLNLNNIIEYEFD